MGDRNPNPTPRGRNRCGERNGRWTGADASYFAVHLRLKHFRGPADCYDCPACGAPAKQWAYDRRAADPRFDAAASRGAKPAEYSVDLAHYVPLCHRCHMAFDGTSAGDRARARTHCPQGHAYDEANTGPNQGNRRCRTCHRERQRERARRRRGQA